MQFTTIVSLLAFTSFITAAPVPAPQLGTGLSVAGLACGALPEECKEVGDTGKQFFKDLATSREKAVAENGAVPVALTDTLAG
ncbi:hypothetical protein TWF106_003578 [Orbilia oligospora]|uniref:Uncharacterized protein n=1 Tax=Orbilia oligospora TaxID=2813651 RepID=A0A6G1MKE0_ORBOL|nr:hypothetical protein TWF788_010329 [Orbilia oligospora]KAF3212287.1 hypothetical protein TWF679_006059 [Orbilia oligospora]KAF3224609.1 hypothetical protein TWF106_003578 [Orbilia oligospora]KAF3261041.1 hypothetical protein TWF192_008974 [Orbilia oligospora]